jgi:hypothetical protein
LGGGGGGGGLRGGGALLFSLIIMPTILGPGFASSFSGYPTRMSQEDVEIWRRYFPTVREGTRAIYFDVGLGLADELPKIDDANQLLGWIRNTQKRADVVIERETRVDLIELRFNASANAVGRLLIYRKLLLEDNPFNKPVRGILVTNRPDSELAALCADNDLDFVVA